MTSLHFLPSLSSQNNIPAAVDSRLSLFASRSLSRFSSPQIFPLRIPFSFPTRLNPSSPRKANLLGIMQTPVLPFRLTFICNAKKPFLVSFAQFSSDLLDIYNFTVGIEAESLLCERCLDWV